MASLTDVLSVIQNGVVAFNNFSKQMAGSLLNISGQLTTDATNIAANTAKITALQFPRGVLGGLTLSTAGGSATFAVAAGSATDSTNVRFINLAASISKTTAAWAVGTGNGSLDTGSITTNGWYHVFLITRLDTGVVDILISLSPTTPTLPTNYTLFRRIGAMATDVSSHWQFFHQLGDNFLWDVTRQDAAAATVQAAGALVTLSVPTGIQVYASFTYYINYVAPNVYSVLTCPDVTSAAASVTNFDSALNPGQLMMAPFSIRTNTAGQIRVRGDAAGGNYYIITKGWTDTRGRDA
jgi:hypothetical protein